MEALNNREIAAALGISYPVAEGVVSSICTDSREAASGSLFVAIPGERVDGHKYINVALSQGASLALAEREGDYPADRVLLVDNTVTAMLALAAWYRDRMSATVVAITGSVGKTTTKDMIAAVLSTQFRTVKTIGNQNNEIGTPRTIMSVDQDTQVAVVEMGMSGFGEIRALAQAAKPQIGVITNIGVSHMEHLGSRENILKAKLELAESLPDGATLFLCADNDLLKKVEIPRLNVVFYGVDNEKAAIRGTVTGNQPTRTDFTVDYMGEQWQASIPGTGKHLVQNSLAAFGIGVELGMEPQAAVAALSDYHPSGMRQNIVDKNGITIVEDCYNASPDSMAAALGTLREFPCTGKRYAVLSDMLELGDLSRDAHRDCGELAAHCVDQLLLWGSFANDYAAGAREAGMQQVSILPDKIDLARLLADTLAPGDVVWFKASRGMKLEEAIEALYALL